MGSLRGLMDVLLLDGHRMVGQVMAGLLAEVAGFEVLGVCTSVAEACALIHRSPPRLMVLDVDLAGESYRPVTELLLQLKPPPALLVVTALARGFRPPADLAPITIGVVDKADAWDQLLAVLRSWWVREQHQPHLPGCDRQLQAIAQLPPREQRLLQELGCGLLNKEIAQRLGLSVATVETYRKGVAAKLGVSGAELVRLATLYRCLYLWEPQTPVVEP